MKKKLWWLIPLAITAVFILSSCSQPPAETNTDSPLTALQNDIASARSDINTLKSRATALEQQIASLELPVPDDVLDAIDELQDGLNIAASDVEAFGQAVVDKADEADLVLAQADIETVETSIAAISTRLTSIEEQLLGIENPDLTPIQTSLDDLAARVTEVEQDVANLDIPDELDLTDVFDMISELQTEMDELQAAMITLNDYFVVVEGQVMNIVNLFSGQYRIEMTKFIPGSTYLEFTTRSPGDYVVVLILYGTGLNNLSVYLPPSQNVELVYDSTFGTANTMRTLILQPKTTGSPPASPNWANGKVVEVDFTGVGFSVNYATVEAGAR